MSKTPNLSPVQARALVQISRSVTAYACFPQRVVSTLVAKGLVRHSFNEFIFRWSPGCSSNSGVILTDAGKAMVEQLRPATHDEVISALAAVKNPTDAQRDTLRRLRSCGHSVSAKWNAPDFTATPVSAAAA